MLTLFAIYSAFRVYISPESGFGYPCNQDTDQASWTTAKPWHGCTMAGRHRNCQTCLEIVTNVLILYDFVCWIAKYTQIIRVNRSMLYRTTVPLLAELASVIGDSLHGNPFCQGLKKSAQWWKVLTFDRKIHQAAQLATVPLLTEAFQIWGCREGDTIRTKQQPTTALQGSKHCSPLPLPIPINSTHYSHYSYQTWLSVAFQQPVHNATPIKNMYTHTHM